MPNGKNSQRGRRAVAVDEPPNNWIDQDLDESTFADERFEKRIRALLHPGGLSGPGEYQIGLTRRPAVLAVGLAGRRPLAEVNLRLLS